VDIDGIQRGGSGCVTRRSSRRRIASSRAATIGSQCGEVIPLAGIGGEPAAPGNPEEEYIAAYEAAWETGNALAIENDPRG